MTRDQARRYTCRHIAAALVQAMAETDTDFETIDTRLGWGPFTAQGHVYALIAGESRSLDIISDLAIAMRCVLDVRVRPGPILPEVAQATAVAAA